jgi:hypothetical protein
MENVGYCTQLDHDQTYEILFDSSLLRKLQTR